MEYKIEEKIVYHGSSTGGLKRLEPRYAKHDKPYVYATTKYWVVLFFATKGQGQFDGWVEYDNNGIPVFYEARQNSFKERYSGKSSYCYCLPAKSFTNATGDTTEVVSEVPVDVLSCTRINDVGAEFDKLIKQNKFKVVYYNSSAENTQEKCEKYVLNLLIKRGYFDGKDFRQRDWVQKSYKNLIEKHR